MAHLSVSQGLAGFFAAIGLYNTLVYYVTSDRTFLWYAVLMESMAGVQFVFAPHLMGSTGHGEALLVYRTASFAAFFAMEAVFAWTFLRLAIRSPRVARAVAIVLAANIVALGIACAAPPSAALRLAEHALFLALLAACACDAWHAAAAGVEDYRYFFAAYAGLFAAALVGDVLDFTPAAQWSSALFQAGALWQAALLTVALASRFFKLDPLTGLKSRRAFDESLIRGWRTAKKHGTGLAVVAVAIHALKDYEARHGRLAGDTMMRRVAAACGTAFRDRADVFARYGDEAFAAILPRLSRSEADALAERMRAAVEESCRITLGIGVASIDEANSSKGLIHRAAQRSARDAIGRAAFPDAAAL